MNKLKNYIYNRFMSACAKLAFFVAIPLMGEDV